MITISNCIGCNSFFNYNFCTYLKISDINDCLNETLCPCQECIVKTMCMEHHTCEPFLTLLKTLPKNCLQHTCSSSSASISYIDYKIREFYEGEYVSPERYNRGHIKRSKNAIFKDSKYKNKIRKYL